MFAGASILKDFYDMRLSIFVALAPVTMLPNAGLETLKYAGTHYGQVDDAVWVSGMHAIGSTNNPGWVSSDSEQDLHDQIDHMMQNENNDNKGLKFELEKEGMFCSMLPDFCFNWTDSWENSDPSTDDQERYQVSLGPIHNGGQTPMKSILHYAQNLDEGRFQKWAPDYHRWFDIGSKKQTKLYDLGAIKVPVAIWTGLNDLVADPTDARVISEQLGDKCVHY
jgi:hypothetical protein